MEEIEEQIDIKTWEKEDNEISKDSKTDSKENQLRVIRINQDYNLDYLNQSIDDNIILGPDYQRRSRWSINQKSLLIESFLLNIPIPPIFLYEKEYHEYEVVDGRQRLEAIRDFFNNAFKLRNLKYFSNLNGLKFEDLNQENQRLLKRRSISATILMAESKGFDELDIRMLLFDRLNTGGVKLNAQELRNAIFSGTFNKLLDELSSNPLYREIWGIPHPEGDQKKIKRLDNSLKKNTLYKSMMDCELVLRVIGLNEVYNEITDGSMRSILDFTMKKYRNIEVELALEIRKKFIAAIEFIHKTFGEDAIKNPRLKPPQRARNIYDSLVVGYWQIDKNNLVNDLEIKENLLTVLKDEKNYERIITKGNSIENIIFRIDMAKKILTNTL